MFCIFALVGLSALLSSASSQRTADNWTVSDLLPKYYNNLSPPKIGGSAVTVAVKVHVVALLAVNEPEQSFTVDIIYKQRWRDARLNIPSSEVHYPLILDTTWKSKLWVPDVYFRNALQSSVLNAFSPIAFIDVRKDGFISYNARMTIKLNCDMDLWAYPQDTQECFFDSVSLTQPRETIHLQWDTFEVDSSINFPKFTIYDYEVDDCSSSEENSNSSCIRGILKLSRKLSYYVIRIYAPSFLIVITSFMGFWLPVLAWPGRIAVVVTPLLSLITIQTTVNTDINVSYVVALHIWMMFCIFFVFMALIEYAGAIVYANSVDDRKSVVVEAPPPQPIPPITISREGQPDIVFRNGIPKPRPVSMTSHYTNQATKALLTRVYGRVDWSKNPLSRNKVDYIARILFPVLYLVFIIVYMCIFVIPWLATKD